MSKIVSAITDLHSTVLKMFFVHFLMCYLLLLSFNAILARSLFQKLFFLNGFYLN